MDFSSTAMLLWAAGFFGNAALLTVLLYKKRARMVSWFTSWVVFQLLYTLVLYALYLRDLRPAYLIVYGGGAFLDLTLQVGIVTEIARYVFRRGDTWVAPARQLLVKSALIAALVGVLFAVWMRPITASKLEAAYSRVDLGAMLFMSMLFSSVLIFSGRLGVSWRSIILREGFGVSAWSICSFMTDSLHAYWPAAEHLRFLEQLRIVSYLIVLVYWNVIFWLPEPLPKVSSERTRKSVESFLREVQSREPPRDH